MDRPRSSSIVLDRLAMTDTVARLKAALADRYTIEREIGAGGMATVNRGAWILPARRRMLSGVI